MEDVSYWYLDNVAGLPAMPAKVVNAVRDWQNWDPLAGGGEAGPAGLIGSGPFMLKGYRAGEYLLFERNPHYRLLEGAVK